MKRFITKYKTRLLAGAGLIFSLYFAGTVTDADANRYVSLLPAFFSFMFYIKFFSHNDTGLSSDTLSRQERSSLSVMVVIFSLISSLANFELYLYPDSDYIAYSRMLFFPLSTPFTWAGALLYLYDFYKKIKGDEINAEIMFSLAEIKKPI